MENTDAPTLETGELDPNYGVFGRHRWAPFVLPMLVFMLLGRLEPKPPAKSSSENEAVSATEDTPETQGFIPYRAYPLVYTARIAGTLLIMALAWAMYRTFTFRTHWLAVACGAVGVVLWVGIASLGLEEMLMPASVAKYVGLSGSRAAYNPFEQLGEQPAALVGFLAVRFLGMALMVPVIEEFFLRGFLMRFVQEQDWWKLPVGVVNAVAWVAVIVYAVVSHPGEMIAAVVWFSLVTWLVTRTKNIWDAVAAHVVTNLLLGVYVVTFGAWELW